MCGIVGLYLKNPKLKSKLGKMFKPMLIEMTNRGPDSTRRRGLPQSGEKGADEIFAGPR